MIIAAIFHSSKSLLRLNMYIKCDLFIEFSGIKINLFYYNANNVERGEQNQNATQKEHKNDWGLVKSLVTNGKGEEH